MIRTTTLALAATCLMHPVNAFAQTEVSLILNWKYQGPQAIFFLAEDKGYFDEAGLDVTIDQGEGSAAAITKVASGAYDMGFGDLNALIALAATEPDVAPVGVFVAYNVPPFAIAVKADSDIRKPADLEGKTIGGPPSDAALKLFPAFTSIAGVDADAVEITNMKPNLREQMLMGDQVDGVFGYVNTITFSAKAAGIDVNDAIRFMRYSDYGMDLYSNTIVASQDFIKEHPDAVKGFVGAVNKAINDVIADPEAAMDSVMEREPLLNREVERERLLDVLANDMAHPEIAEIGLGAVDPDRLNRAIDIVVKANGLDDRPEAEAVFTDRFLPPRSERLESTSNQQAGQ